MNESENTIDESFKLIITITKKGIASKVVAASKKAGSEGGTILLGRGTAEDTYLNVLGLNFGLEREIILTFVKEDNVDNVLQAIIEEGKLNKPGNGIGFIVNIKGIAGIFHMLRMHQT